MTLLAACAGILIAALGVMGAADPGAFIGLVAAFQAPVMIQLAAAIRIAIGVTLFLAAPRSRHPNFLRFMGGAIFIGGVVTPFGGAWLGRTLLDLWSSWGPLTVRVFGIAATLLGGAILYAVAAPARPAQGVARSNP